MIIVIKSQQNEFLILAVIGNFYFFLIEESKSVSESETEIPPSCSLVFPIHAVLCSALLCFNCAQTRGEGDLRLSKVDLRCNLSWKKPFLSSIFY